jgi:hypothetical protein
MMTTVNQWGPAILVCFTVLIGIILNNPKLDDLRGTSTNGSMTLGQK